MKTVLLLLSFLLCFHLAFSQNQPEIVGFTNTTCNTTFEKLSIPTNAKLNLDDRVKYADWYGDTLVVGVFLTANCGLAEHPIPAIEMSADTLNLIWNTAGDTTVIELEDGSLEIWVTYGPTECDCYFCFEYTLLGVPKSTQHIAVNGTYFKHDPNEFDIPKVAFELKGLDTINRYDEFGRKQGAFVSYDENSRLKDSLIYVNDDPIAGIAHIRYYESGIVKFYWQYTRLDRSTSGRPFPIRSLFVRDKNGRMIEKLKHKSNMNFKPRDNSLLPTREIGPFDPK